MTYLPKKEAAIVSDHKRDKIDLYIPKTEENIDMPRCMVYMMACAMRYNADPAFVNEQIAWLTSAVVKASGGLQ